MGWDGVDDSLDLGGLSVPVLALIGDEEQAGEAWLAGCRGMIRRDTSPDDILVAINATVTGFVVMAQGLVSSIGREVPFDSELPAEDLTPREKEVLELVAQGLTNKAIGLRLSISEHTVKFHLNSVLGKLGAQSRTDAVVKATRQGLISL
ncbi:MAG: response regulator transcription factor [Chloroflexota bacterium]